MTTDEWMFRALSERPTDSMDEAIEALWAVEDEASEAYAWTLRDVADSEEYERW